MAHDRIHAREPSHHVDRWTPGRIESIAERDGHAVVTVQPMAIENASGATESVSGVTKNESVADSAPTESSADAVDLVVTFAVRDLFVRRLDLEDGESPVGERVWYRVRGE